MAARNIVVSPLKDLRPNRSAWKIHVKILHVYKYYSSNNSYSLELIFVDESGDKMSASVKREHVKKFESSLVLGTWKFVTPMTVNAVSGLYRVSDLMFRITFQYNTIVSPSQYTNDSLFLSFANYNAILDGSMDTNILVDVIGQVVDCGEGQRIEAVIEDPYVDHYYDFIDEGMWISIMHFVVRNNIDPIKSCNHNFKIFFSDFTVVKPAQSINNVPLNQFVPFSSILGDLVDTEILIDLVGEIIDVGHLENISTNINEVGGWRLTFKLRNRENRVLNGMTQGNEALQFNQNYQPFRGSKLVVALRFWKIDRFSNGKKNVQIRTHGAVSKIYPNPNIPEAHELNPIVIE